VAIALLRKRAGSEAGRRLRADLLATLISGSVDAPEARSRLGLDGTSMRVLALELGSVDGVEGEAARLRFTDAFALHLNAISPHSAAVLIGDVVYGVLPLPSDRGQSDLARQVADSFVRRVGALTPNVGIGRVADSVEDLMRSRRDADRSLRVLRTQGLSGRICQAEDSLLDVMLLSLRDFMRAEVMNDVVAPVHRLLDYDRRHRTQLVTTLETYLDCSTDVAQASAALNVHPNTLRYRLRRCASIGGLDLADPNQRLEVWIRLRMARMKD
jgi:DNA-binding PucR family transcriptional regulator